MSHKDMWRGNHQSKCYKQQTLNFVLVGLAANTDHFCSENIWICLFLKPANPCSLLQELHSHLFVFT